MTAVNGRAVEFVEQPCRSALNRVGIVPYLDRAHAEPIRAEVAALKKTLAIADRRVAPLEPIRSRSSSRSGSSRSFRTTKH